MVSSPNCKINLGLNITGKRTDGYHDLETCFLPVGLKDELEIIPSDTPKMQFTNLGTQIVGDISKNLCIQAYQLIKEAFPDKIKPLHITLNKIIPMGAGLGGGSADGAFTLLMMNEYLGLNLSQEQLIEFALILGSDCPFFIMNKPCIAKGRGELLEPSAVNLSGYKVLIVNPGIHIATRWAFEQITPKQPAKSIQEIILQPINTWQKELVNDFEGPVSRVHHNILAIKRELISKGAAYASMTGSGSTVFGLFKKVDLKQFSFPKNFLVKVADIL